MNYKNLYKKMTAFIFIRLIICAVVAGWCVFLLEYSGIISLPAVKLLVLLAFIAGLCLYAVFDIIRYVKAAFDTIATTVKDFDDSVAQMNKISEELDNKLEKIKDRMDFLNEVESSMSEIVKKVDGFADGQKSEDDLN